MRRDRKKEKKVYIKRLLFIKIFITSIVICLILRLFYIQVLQHDFYMAEINKQRQIQIPINSGRGIIFDRNLIPLTDRKDQKVAVIFPQLFAINQESIKLLEKITKGNGQQWISRIQNSKYILEIPVNTEIDWNDKRAMNVPGLFIVDKKQRYEDHPLLSHTIGYINQVDKKGLAGVERAMDGILMTNSSQSLTATVDGRKHLLPGEGYTIANNSTKQRDIMLTIDYTIQQIAEKVMDKKDLKGAVVISDIKTGEILSIVSRPNYNPNKIVQHINSSGDELYNKGVQMAFPPGSIFKIILAAEGLEKGVVDLDDIFYCKGYEEIGDISIKCSVCSLGEAEEISFKRAFAESCNSTFIQLGQELGAKNIISMARKAGFGSVIDIGLLEEEAGTLPKDNELLGPAIGNLSIGQGNLEVTPLQVNQLTQIIANDGVKKPLFLFKEILVDQHTLETFKEKQSSKILSKGTVNKLQELMESVMKNGTGKGVDKLANNTAGKTGTAQSFKKGEAVLHAWFTGYYPVDSPQYSITVLIQEGGYGGAVAVPVFKEILEEMISQGY